jgi:hypothetical protein
MRPVEVNASPLQQCRWRKASMERWRWVGWYGPQLQASDARLLEGWWNGNLAMSDPASSSCGYLLILHSLFIVNGNLRIFFLRCFPKWNCVTVFTNWPLSSTPSLCVAHCVHERRGNLVFQVSMVFRFHHSVSI